MGSTGLLRTCPEKQDLAVVKQYRDTLSWTAPGTPPGTDPETGDPIPGTPGEARTAQCRYENFRSNNHREWVDSDGKVVKQRGTIYVKDGEACPDQFEVVTVTSPEFQEVFHGETLNVYKGQLNYTIAV